MIRYIIRRLIQSLFVVVGVVTAVFIITNLTGDPIRLMVGEAASPQDIEKIRHQLGLDRPLYVQYWEFLRNAARGDFQDSLQYSNFSSIDIVLTRFPRTIVLAVTALTISVVLGIALGTAAAVARASAIDSASMLVALLGQSIPNFWLGIMLILVFSVSLGWLPSQGYELSVSHLLLPTVTLAVTGMARLTRLTRATMIEVLSADYIRTAQAKGLRSSSIVFGHALKNASIPIVTIIGLDFGNLLAGSIIVEQIFNWNGVGQLLVESISARDFPVVQAAVFVIAVSFVSINLIVDILYAFLDPRIRLS